MFYQFCRRCWRRCNYLPAVLDTKFLPIKKSASISSWQYRYPTLRTGTCTRPRDAGGLQSAPRSSGLQLLHALRQYSLFTSSDTVFALSSGHGKCGMCYHRWCILSSMIDCLIVCHSLRSILLCFAIGVAVVRVSGSHALEVGLISQPDPLVHNLSLPFFVEVGLACETKVG